MNEIKQYTQEVTSQLADKETFNTLVQTTFNGLALPQVKQAMVEGMMRGFTFKDFIRKDVYAIPFKTGYALITSIDYVRKIAMRSGLAGVNSPEYDEDASGNVRSCSVTVKRRDESGYIGEYTAEAFLDEYSTGKNLWVSKPRTMLAKVAEMQALRKAFPEELSKAYIEEERGDIFQGDVREAITEEDAYIKRAHQAKSVDELKEIFRAMPQEQKNDKDIIAKFAEIKKSLV